MPHPLADPSSASSSADPSDAAAPAAADPSAGAARRAATAVSSAASPALLGGACLLLAGFRGGGATGVAWALVVALVILGLPMLVLTVLSHRGRYADRFVPERADRLPVYLVVGALMAGVLALLMLGGPRLGVPSVLTLTVVLLLLGLLVLLPITLRWKVSAHSAMAGAFAIAVPVLGGGWLVALSWVVPVAVVWSRVTLRAHTFWQAVVGAWIGLVLGGVFGAAVHILP